MKTEEILSKVKSNYGSYESISLANDDVERLLILVTHIQKQKKVLEAALEMIKNHDTHNLYNNQGNAYKMAKIAEQALKGDK